MSTTDNDSDETSCASRDGDSVLPMTGEFLLKCIGMGYKNLVKPTF
jgi:hypothetical protein